MDFIKTYEEACQVEGIDPVQNLPYQNPQNGNQKALNALAKLFVIIAVLNMQSNDGKKWTPDWKKSRDWKYWPWFDLNPDEDDDPSGLGLSFRAVGSAYSRSLVGSRLCFRTEELAKYAAKTFTSEYADFMLM